MPRVRPECASSSSDENKDTANPMSVVHLLNPVITLMRFCGACIGPRVTVENIGCSDYRFRLLDKYDWFQTLYSVLINSYLWIYTGILSYKLVFFEPMSSDWIIVFQFLAINITASSICTWSSLAFRHGIYQRWVEDFYMYEQCYGAQKNMKDMVQKSRIVVAFVMSFAMFGPGLMLTFALTIPTFGDIAFIVDRSLGRWNYLVTVINYFNLFTSVFSSMIRSVIGSYPLCSELDVINTIMRRCADDMQHQETLTLRSESASVQNYERNEQLSAIISRHKYICSLISGFGDSIAYFQFTGFFLSLPLSCFSLYVIMTRIDSQSNVYLCTIILVLCSVSCIVMSLVGVRVNVKAHAALQCMLKIPTTHLSETTMRAVSQFTSLLTGTTIGYNVYGLFTISPPTILSIVATLVTYVVVVLQFRQSDSQASPDTLCQDLVANLTLLLEDKRNASCT